MDKHKASIHATVVVHDSTNTVLQMVQSLNCVRELLLKHWRHANLAPNMTSAAATLGVAFLLSGQKSVGIVKLIAMR